MGALTIGAVAKKSEVNVETVRYYERRGLLERPPDRAEGYREYPLDAIRRIRFIKRAKELGFSLNEIKELISLRVEPGTTCGEVRERATMKISDIETKIHSLKAMKKALMQLEKACSGKGPVGECPILEYLDTDSQEAK